MCRKRNAECKFAKTTMRNLQTRKRKRPARTSPGEAQLFTVAILHSAGFFPRVKQMFCCQQTSSSYPVDSASANVAACAVKWARVANVVSPQFFLRARPRHAPIISADLRASARDQRRGGRLRSNHWHISGRAAPRSSARHKPGWLKTPSSSRSPSLARDGRRRPPADRLGGAERSLGHAGSHVRRSARLPRHRRVRARLRSARRNDRRGRTIQNR